MEEFKNSFENKDLLKEESEESESSEGDELVMFVEDLGE